MLLDTDLNKYRSQIESMRSGDQNEYPHINKQVYLDHAANAIYPASLIRAYERRLTSSDNWSLFSNPHSHSQSAAYTTTLVDSVREKILSGLFESSSKDYDLVFVSNATAGLKLLGECLKPDCLAYFLDNHTSVIGLREIIEPNSHVFCVSEGLDGDLQFKVVKHSNQRKEFKKNLFIFPAQSNFNGRRYNLDLIDQVQSKTLDELKSSEGEWFVCLDASSYMSTSPLSLKSDQTRPDFIVLSFYKLFGFPTSLGALLIRKTERVKDHLTAKRYFGGGTVEMALIESDRVVVKNFTCREGENGSRRARNYHFHEAFEDGTLPYLEIIATGLAIDHFQKLTLGNGFNLIRQYLNDLSEYLIKQLTDLKHFNDHSLVEIYRREINGSILTDYGPIISFNLKNSKGDYIGFKLVEKLAQESQIHLRTGCFCNIGACQTYLPHLTHESNFYFSHGHKCGDHIDLIDRKPTGAIRVSLGYCSTQQDCNQLVEFLKSTFIDLSHPLQNSFGNRSMRPEQISYFKISGIFIYPIKSCAPMRIENKWPLRNSGFIYDREWLIVDNDRIPLSQKRTPELINIRPFIDLDRNVLSIQYKEDFYEINLCNDDNKRNREQIWIGKSELRGYDQGDDVANWLSRVIGDGGVGNKLCRLIRCEMSAANKAEFLLVNENSVRSLSRFREGEQDLVKKTTVDQLSVQFRPNIVIKPLDSDEENGGFDEEKWSQVKILNRAIEFEVVENCVRCHMINIDQQSNRTGDYSSLLKQLYKFKENSKFGIYLKRKREQSSENDKKREVNLIELEVGDIGLALTATTDEKHPTDI